MEKDESKKKKNKSKVNGLRLKQVANKMARKGDIKDPQKSSAKTSTASKTATATKTSTSTDAYTQGNITVTGGAGRGATSVTIGLPGGSLENNSKKRK